MEVSTVSPVSVTSEKEKSSPEEANLLYKIYDVPPWYICIFLGLQNYLEMIGATVACPFFLAPAICMADDDPDKANIISTLVFISGIITILQTTFGTRLPIVQGGSFSYLIPALAIMKLPEWQCPSAQVLNEMSPANRTEEWQLRMREIQGAIIFASAFEALFAVTGIIGLLVKYLTPMTVAPAISMIGIALFREASSEASKNFPVAISTLVLLILLSQHLRNVKLPNFCGKTKDESNKFPIFQVFPVLISVALVWSVCGILTAADVLKPGDPARTDSKLKILEGSPWFRIPYPFQWGWPTVSLGAVVGLLCGVMSSTIESIGDYYACAAITNAPTPPVHAMNRGIFMEGLGCILGGIWGSGNGSTSYSNCIGTISVTRVASRRVIQIAGVIMIVLSLVGKAGAVFVALPDPIVAGMFLFIFPLVMAAGLGTLAEVSLESGRNIFIVSFSIFMGLCVSQWAATNQGVIKTGSDDIDNLLQILLSTGMFVGGIIGFILDNTIPGTDQERGITTRLANQQAAILSGDTSYDLPFGMDWIRRTKFLRRLPISPTYTKHIVEELPVCKRRSTRL